MLSCLLPVRTRGASAVGAKVKRSLEGSDEGPNKRQVVRGGTPTWVSQKRERPIWMALTRIVCLSKCLARFMFRATH